jgi:hypothetical protein
MPRATIEEQPRKPQATPLTIRPVPFTCLREVQGGGCAVDGKPAVNEGNGERATMKDGLRQYFDQQVDRVSAEAPPRVPGAHPAR